MSVIEECSIGEIVEVIYKQSIDALKVISEYVYKTPVLHNSYLDKVVGCKTFLKLENLQLTGAFKVRGAVYKIHKLARTSSIRGVIAASSGNHGLGVAYASKLHGVRSVVVMPKTASLLKINRARELGAEVIIHGDYLDEAYDKAMELSNEMNYVFIHSYEDVDTISGQATIAHEILEVVKPRYVLVPIGGGGLISGLAVVFKKKNPGVKIIGIEPKNSPKMYNYIKHGLSETDVKPSVADAVVVKKPGRLASKIVEEYVDDIVTVDEREIIDAIYFSIDKLKIIVEGAGALPIASLLSNSVRIDSEPVVGIVTGGNIDPLIVREIIEKKEFSNRVFILRGIVGDNTSVINRVFSILNQHNCRVLSIYLNRLKPSVDFNKVYLEIVVETRCLLDTGELINEFKKQGIELELDQ